MNTHKKEILRFAEAPDGTSVWVLVGREWLLEKSVSWSPDLKYVVDDGFYVDTRKSFAEGAVVKFATPESREKWFFTADPEWNENNRYKVAEPVAIPASSNKEWYKRDDSVGKFILVSDVNDDKGATLVAEFLGYVEKSGFRFRTDRGPFRYAWVIDPDRLVREEAAISCPQNREK